MNYIACQASLSMDISRQEYRSILPFPSPGYLASPGVEPGSPALQADSLPSEPPVKPIRGWGGNKEKIANLGINLPAYLEQWDWLVGWVKDNFVHYFTPPPDASKTMLIYLFMSFRSKIPQFLFWIFLFSPLYLFAMCSVDWNNLWIPWLFSLVKWNWKLHLFLSPTFFSCAEWSRGRPIFMSRNQTSHSKFYSNSNPACMHLSITWHKTHSYCEINKSESSVPSLPVAPYKGRDISYS